MEVREPTLLDNTLDCARSLPRNGQALRKSGPAMVLGSDVLKLGGGAMIVSSLSSKIWLAL